MAGPTTWRRVAPAVVALAALALAGCGGGQNPPAADTAGGAQVGAAPATPTPTSGGKPSGEASPTGGNTGGTGAPTYPKDAKSYAQEFLKAWARVDYTRLGLYGELAAVQQVRDSVTTGGNPNSQWTHIRCGPSGQSGYTDCVFRNAHGDETVVTMADAKLGSPTAVTAAPLDRTRYNDDPASYVVAFLGAWRDGNAQRMVRLSSTSVRNSVQGKTPISSYTSVVMTLDGTYAKVTLSGLGDDLGRSLVFKVLAKPGGKANAIKTACDPAGGCPI